MVLSLNSIFMLVGLATVAARALTLGFSADLYQAVCILFATWDAWQWLPEEVNTDSLRTYFGAK